MEIHPVCSAQFCKARRVLAAMGMLLLAASAGYAQSSAQAAAAVPAIAPSVTLAPYGLMHGHAVAGWPLILTASAVHPDAPSSDPGLKPILLASETGHWAAACRITVTDSGGKPAKWPLHAAMAAAKPISLDGASAARTAWWLSGEETSAIPPGSYFIDMVLDTSALNPKKLPVGAWKGTVRTRFTVQIGKEPADMSPIVSEQKSLLKANLAMLRKDNAGALAEVNSLLQNQPKNIHGLTTKGDLLAAQGKDSEALDAYQQAIDLVGKTGEPPVQLLQRYQALTMKMLKH